MYAISYMCPSQTEIMGGIFFLRTMNQAELVEFYTDSIGMEIWLEQPDCVILKHDNLLLGFCERESRETEGMITFVYDTKEEVDTIYEKLQDIATGAPIENSKYQIYQFFAEDPEGRALEFQVFLHPTKPI
jgi:predicted lactoylglutathione lyase